MWVSSFCTTFFRNIFYSKKELGEISSKMYIGFHVKYPLLLSNFNETWIFSTDFWEILKCQISWKSVHCERSFSMRTDRHSETNSSFLQFFERASKRRHCDTVSEPHLCSFVLFILMTHIFWLNFFVCILMPCLSSTLYDVKCGNYNTLGLHLNVYYLLHTSEHKIRVNLMFCWPCIMVY
jgi:hypothetical protein